MKLNGNKTYIVMAALLGYLLVSALTQTEVTEEVVYSLLGLGGLTLRDGVRKAEGPKDG